MNLYLVRHTETVDNVNRVIQGQSDSNLTPDGIIMAANSFTYFSDISLNKIISSPLGRALKTSWILSEINGGDKGQIEVDSSFKEIDLGRWTKSCVAQLMSERGLSSYQCYKNSPQLFFPLDGESLTDLTKRVLTGYQNIIGYYSNADNIAIVSHSVAIRALLLRLENKGIEHVWEYNIPFASKTKIVVKNGVGFVERIGF